MGGRSRPGALYDPVWSLKGLETLRNGLQFNSTLSSYRHRHSQPPDLKPGIQMFKASLYPWHREAILLQNPCSSHSSVKRQQCTNSRRAVWFEYHVVVAKYGEQGICSFFSLISYLLLMISIDCWNYFRLLFLSLLLRSSRSKDSLQLWLLVLHLEKKYSKAAT